MFMSFHLALACTHNRSLTSIASICIGSWGFSFYKLRPELWICTVKEQVEAVLGDRSVAEPEANKSRTIEYNQPRAFSGSESWSTISWYHRKINSSFRYLIFFWLDSKVWSQLLPIWNPLSGAVSHHFYKSFLTFFFPLSFLNSWNIYTCIIRFRN